MLTRVPVVRVAMGRYKLPSDLEEDFEESLMEDNQENENNKDETVESKRDAGQDENRESEEIEKSKEVEEISEDTFVSRLVKLDLDAHPQFEENDNTEVSIKDQTEIWKHFGDVVLTYKDMSVIRDVKKPINFNIINAVQKLLKFQYGFSEEAESDEEIYNNHINGLFPVSLWTISDDFESVDGKFVQLFQLNSGHWITLSNVTSEDNQVVVYDCYCLSKFEGLTFEMEKAILKLKPNVEEIIYQLVTQQTEDLQDSLMAIVFAETLCRGWEPSHVLFSDSPIQLRRHLFECLEKEKLSMFPTGSQQVLAKFVFA